MVSLLDANKFFPYKFYAYEPGIFVELYLPKKSEYQGTLFDTLTSGFKLSLVKQHFLGDKRLQINQLLANYKEFSNYSDKQIKRMRQLFWGYSMYEVDGVFFSSMQPEKIFEENTQVIRMIFLADLQHIRQSLNLPVKKLSKIRAIVSKYLSVNSIECKKMLKSKNKIERKISKLVDCWTEEVGLFLFGYVIFEICTRIRELNLDKNRELEEEIWLSSFWNLRINRVSLNINNK